METQLQEPGTESAGPTQVWLKYDKHGLYTNSSELDGKPARFALAGPFQTEDAAFEWANSKKWYLRAENNQLELTDEAPGSTAKVGVRYLTEGMDLHSALMEQRNVVRDEDYIEVPFEEDRKAKKAQYERCGVPWGEWSTSTSCPQDPKARYSGIVVDINEEFGFVHQYAGRGRYWDHQSKNFDVLPEIGPKPVLITYDESGRAKTVSMERSQAKGIER